MLLADINDTPYNIILFVHIVLMFVAFAPAFVHPFLEAQTKDDPNRAGFWGAVVVRSQRIYGGALILGGLLGFGVAGMSKAPGTDDLVYSVSDGWILTAVILWVAMNGVLHAMIIPGERALAQGDESKAQQLQIGGVAITLLFLVTMYLMVFKPGA